MVLWFAVIFVLGALPSSATRRCCEALNPLAGLTLLFHRPAVALAIIGAVFLAITGGEALYADMGHFGKRPVRIAWFAMVAPALVVNYFGQGALLLEDRPADRAPVLPPDLPAAAAVAGGAGHGGRGHRLAGGDLRRLLHGAPGRAP